MREKKDFLYEAPQLKIFSYRDLSIVHGQTEECDTSSTFNPDGDGCPDGIFEDDDD